MDFNGFTGETARMRLRPYRASDLAEHVDLHRREDVVRYLPWDVRDQAASAAAIERSQPLRMEADGDSMNIAGFDKESGRLVGEFILILKSLEHRTCEVGYVVHPDFHGRGLATEGAAFQLQIAFDVLGMHRVIARLDARNTPSALVLERLGMRREALLLENEWFKGEWTDELDYALLEAEWANSPTRSLISWRADAPPRPPH